MPDSFVTPWTVAHQAPLSMGFPSQEYWNGLPFPSPRDLHDQGIKFMSPALAGGFFTPEPPGKLEISHTNKTEHSNHKKSREGAKACDSNPSRERKAVSLSPTLPPPLSHLCLSLSLSLSVCYSKSHFSWVLCLKICLLVKFICNPDQYL